MLKQLFLILVDWSRGAFHIGAEVVIFFDIFLSRLVKRWQESKVDDAQMRMLRWMSGHTLQDRIRSENIKKKVGVMPIEEKMVFSA